MRRMREWRGKRKTKRMYIFGAHGPHAPGGTDLLLSPEY